MQFLLVHKRHQTHDWTLIGSGANGIASKCLPVIGNISGTTLLLRSSSLSILGTCICLYFPPIFLHSLLFFLVFVYLSNMIFLILYSLFLQFSWFKQIVFIWKWRMFDLLNKLKYYIFKNETKPSILCKLSCK